MDDLILRALQGTIGPEDSGRLQAWRNASSANERHYQDVVHIWEATELKRQKPRPQASDIIVASEKVRGPERKFVSHAVSQRRVFPLLKYAAVLAAIAAVSYTVLQPSGRPNHTVYTADGSSPTTITLEDGSIVRLAAGASLQSVSMETTRSVILDGKAFFAVKPDPDRPFTVQTETGLARVLGTRFEIYGEDDRIRLIVRDGLVALQSGDDSVHVAAGQMAAAEINGPVVVTTPNGIDSLLDWPNGVLVFRDTRLSFVAEELSSHFEREVVVADSTLARVPVTVWFDGEPFEEAIETVCLITGIECDLSASPIRLSAESSQQ